MSETYRSTSDAHSKPAREPIQLFANPWLEKLTHVHPVVPFLVWLPVLGLVVLKFDALALSPLSTTGWIALGLLFWTLNEYLMHRFLFHFKASSRLGERIVFIAHGVHHEDPHDSTRLVVPPVPGLILGSLFFLLFRVALGEAQAMPFFVGFIAGYLAYDYIHYSVHHIQPRTRVGKFLRKYHYTHHFADHEAKWGVSSPLWDWVFGTMGRKI